MKLIVLAGEDTTKSYTRLQKFIEEAKNRGWEIVQIEDPKPGVLKLFSIQSLFQEKRLFIIEEPGSIPKKELENILSHKDDTITTVLYYKRDLTPAQKKTLCEYAKVEEFPLPKIIWSFLDSFYPGSSKKCLQLFHELLLHTSLEVLLVLLVRHLRDLVWVQTENPPKYPSWRVGKLKSQSKRFSSGSIEDIIEELAKIDYQSKIGAVDPIIALDFLIAEKLQ